MLPTRASLAIGCGSLDRKTVGVAFEMMAMIAFYFWNVIQIHPPQSILSRSVSTLFTLLDNRQVLFGILYSLFSLVLGHKQSPDAFQFINPLREK
jgi:hypothetical protein